MKKFETMPERRDEMTHVRNKIFDAVVFLEGNNNLPDSHHFVMARTLLIRAQDELDCWIFGS